MLTRLPWFSYLSRRSVAGGLLALSVVGCASPSVDVESRPGVEVARLGPASVELVADGIAREIEAAPFLAEDLVRVAQETVRAKGYELVRPEDARLRIFVVPRLDIVFRTTFSGDPDNGGTRPVPREAAVILVRAVDVAKRHDVWRASVRHSMPAFDLGRSRQERWKTALVAGLDALDPAEEAH